MAYVVLVEQLERRVLADRQALITRGVVEGLPALGVEQAAFDARLAEEPKLPVKLTVAEVEQQEERRALGVA